MMTRLADPRASQTSSSDGLTPLNGSGTRIPKFRFACPRLHRVDPPLCGSLPDAATLPPPLHRQAAPMPQPTYTGGVNIAWDKMPKKLDSLGENFCEIEGLIQIRARCDELREEKNMLRMSQSQSFELIRSLDVYLKTLSEARLKDNKRIQELERELNNCFQEIDFLLDQLNSRNGEILFLEEYVHKLKLQLAEMENLQEMVRNLQAELRCFDLEQLHFIQELDSKENKLEDLTSCVEKLEESVSYVGLESQCEIESLKLGLISIEQSFFEAEKSKDIVRESATMHRTIQELEAQLQVADKAIQSLGKENKELSEKLENSEANAREFRQSVEEHLAEWLEDIDILEDKFHPVFLEMETELISSEEISMPGKVPGPLRKLAMLAASHGNLQQRIHEYELTVHQLKDELRKEKLKAQEEAEELAQEMAELRYQITGLLEQEHNRRVRIEQASLQRIAELEAQIEDERSYSCQAIV